ncbi:MAG: hypothetical protein FWC64_13245 [Treponema sp.]|nr:hypothetical protein [Treponema sp.]
MKIKAISLIAALLLVFTLIGCGGEDTTLFLNYNNVIEGIDPVPNMPLAELIQYHDGAQFNNHFNRSLRFFADGGFQSFTFGLGSGISAPGTWGNRYRIDGDRIFFYFDPPAPAAPATEALHSWTFQLYRHVLTFTASHAGTNDAMTNAVMPMTRVNQHGQTVLHEYSFGPIPNFRP